MISVVIPTYTINKHLEGLAVSCASSLKAQADELIICEDGGMYSPILQEIATSYIYNHQNLGFTGNYNRGWRYALGDYVMLVNSDIILREGRLIDLCIPGIVTSPVIVNQDIPRLAGPFFVVPKEVKEKYGLLREEMRTYYSDDEYDHRISHIFQKVPTVRVFHHHAQTVTAAGVEGGQEAERDGSMYHKLKEEGKVK